MNRSISTLAEQVIRTADRTHPADAVLRQTLKSQRDLFPADAPLLTRTVFTYYRWRGWLNHSQPLRQQLEHAQHLAEQFAQHPEKFSDTDLLARTVPAWLKDEMELTPAWTRSLQREPTLWLRARKGQGKAVTKGLGCCRAFGDGPLADTLEYQGHKDLFRTAAFHGGEFELQDLSSQAVGLVCAPNPGETWWDACAGEGGKLLHLSSLMENKGLIWASDRAAWRLQKLKRRAARAGAFNYRAAAWDGGSKLPTKTKFNGVLVDAPCSGLGTWQRNPHARWTTTLQDIQELSAVQKQLLVRAASSLKPGGKLVYSVCTLSRAETSEVVAAFEKQFPNFKRLPVVNPLKPGSAPLPELWFWPQEFSGNGMFVAAWQS